MTLFLALLLATTAFANDSSKLLWDNWYTMTSGKTPYGYYNERVEVRGEKIHFQNKLWKREEGFINEEQLGTVAESMTLKPLFFNFHANYRATEITIDGNIASNLLTAKIHKGKEEVPTIKRSFGGKPIFSQFFPVWLGLKLKEMKPGRELTFSAILEDNMDLGFTPVTGRVKLEKPDDLAAKTGTQKITVNYQGNKSMWWVESSGAPIRIEMAAQKVLVERATPEKAQKFLATE
jgi:hypothetical protein